MRNQSGSTIHVGPALDGTSIELRPGTEAIHLFGSATGESTLWLTVWDVDGRAMDTEESYYEGGYSMYFLFDGHALVVTRWH